MNRPIILSTPAAHKFQFERGHRKYASDTINILDEDGNEILRILIDASKLDTATALILSQLEERKEEAA